MKLIIALVGLALAGSAVADTTYVDGGGTCYSWSGGFKSAGSFSNCTSWAKIESPPAAPVAAPEVAPRPEIVFVERKASPAPTPLRKAIKRRIRRPVDCK